MRPGQSGSLIPEVLGNAFARMRAALAPVFKLPRQLSELVVSMESGVGFHARLPVVGFLLIRMTVGD